MQLAQLTKPRNQNERVVIGPGIVFKKVLSNGDGRPTQNVELAFEIRSRLQAIREDEKHRARLHGYRFHADALFLDLSGGENNEDGSEKSARP